MVLTLVLRSVQEIKAMRGAGLSETDSSRFLPALNWLRSAPSDLVKWSGPKHPVMVLGGLLTQHQALNSPCTKN